MFKKNLIAIVLTLSSFVACNKEGKVSQDPVIIGYQEISLYRHLFTAKAKGYFEQEGVNVEIKPFVSANRMMEGVLAGELQGTGLTNLQVALTVEGKDPNRIKLINMLVWRNNSYPDYILVRSKANIKSVKDLEGRTVALHPGSAVKAFSRTTFEHLGLNLDKIKFLEMEPTIMQASVLAERVDALYAMDPVATNLLESKLCSVLVANPMQYIFSAPVPISGTALSTKFLKERPDEAKRIILALEKSIKYMREPNHEEEIASYIAKYTPISKELVSRMNISEYWTLSEIDRNQVQALANRFHELNIVEKAVDINTFILSGNFLSIDAQGSK